MNVVFYAHSKVGESFDNWQQLDTHLKNVALRARDFAAAFGSGQWGYVVGLLHDIGKYSKEFQSMIRVIDDKRDRHKKINHSTAGALLAIEQFGLAGRIIAYIVTGHHAGLPDWAADETGNASLSVRVRDVDLLHAIAENIPREFLDIKFPDEKPRKGTNPALWIRMLFSCLVDADFLDTEEFADHEKAIRRGNYPGISTLLSSFSDFMNEKLLSVSDTHVNMLRTQILNRCKEAAVESPGIYTLTVPTGGGKTLSSMAFALNHAVMWGKKKIIYVIPYTSIIEQTADQFRKIFGDAVIEHHSNLDTTEESEETIRIRLACENWDAPIIVTTAVQFFESLFAARSSRCRKLHNIVNSVVVLDEAQLLPPEYLNPILFSLNELRRNYYVTFLLTTATQPAFSPQPSFGFTGLQDVSEIIPNPKALHAQFKRVEIETAHPLSEPMSWESVAESLCQHPSVLCIVNRRDDCRMLWKLMPEGTYHLSALMCGAHRSHTIAEIKDRLKAGIPTRVISTQLIEAGVDVDFPVVYRALCGLDSVAQAAGRCNREGLMESGKVIIFRLPSEPPAGYLRQAAGIGKRILEKGLADPISPDCFTSFFEELYWIQGDRLDAKGIMQDLKPDSEFRFSFRTAARKFKLIDDSRQESVIVSYREGESLIRELERREPDRYLFRQLQRYVVNLPRYLHERLLKDGAIRQIYPGIYIQALSSMYDENMGFCPDKSIIFDPDDLII
ncbi:MAG TPA: CRISPR-associated helicase Cas3' [Deltaproteobacteria bacterium]|mgnify:CR=1 FL=1|nr:CRISPR-associated helicase Cas3' [Deltaproteobacteria bacterium]HOH80841.1 CRISPR-associated helicase Cas3' [Methanoregulaceae archaeon]HPR02633.1 CRISPR-associated helicase Cas3' [Deltaproteobacteria bacterium]